MLYFGYGSNMSERSLRLKEVHPLASEPAVAPDWRLVFDIRPLMAHEGHFANIAPRGEARAVHGTLHRLDERDMAAMDRMEGDGFNYRRRPIRVRTYAGRELDAWAYVGLHPAPTPGPPTQRYLNLLVEGAEHSGVEPEYVAWLRTTPIQEVTDPGPFPVDGAPARVFRRADLEADPRLAALGGLTFDLSDAPEFLRRIFGGRVLDVLVLRRLDTSDGEERLEDAARGRLTPEQRAHLNRHVHDLAHLCALRGRFDYEL